MRMDVLGCDGGIGDGRHTMALRIDDDVLIDAGTGLGRLSTDQIARIRHVFLTHAHMDHMALLPLLLDARLRMRAGPITLHGLPETIETMRAHVFNWSVWPDPAELPSPDSPAMRYAPLPMGESVRLGDRTFTPLPATHSIPAAGYRLDSAEATVVFSGDTALCEPFWDLIDRIPRLRALIVEISYQNGREDVARRAGHLCASMLAPKLAALKEPIDVHIAHRKPSDAARIALELPAIAGIHRIRVLEEGDVLEW
jgi:3',5'-cyclic-nucleotide phosphodiesterase